MTTEKKIPTAPTEDEIVERIRSLKQDFFGFQTNDLLLYLSYEKAKEFLKPEVTAAQWAEIHQPISREKLLKEMEEYMDFAWEKAKNCRGLSAGRSIDHYMAWTFLAGDRDLTEALAVPYQHYGKDHLVMICKHYGWDPERWDDHRRVNSETEG